MTPRAIVWLFIFIMPSLLQAEPDLARGEPLQVLYRRVWGYRNPDQVATRVGPMGYQSAIQFVEADRKFAGFVKVRMAKGDEFYVKQKLVASQKGYSRDQLEEDIAAGRRHRSQYARYNLSKLGLGPTLGIAAGILILLVWIWRKFHLIDRWFAKYGRQQRLAPRQPWFIKCSLFCGLVIGAFLTFLAPAETEWFLHEGFRPWTAFPSVIDWILWAAVMLFGLTVVAGVVNPFVRFTAGGAALYAALAIALMGSYFLVGVLSGGVVAAILLGWGLAQGGSGSSGSSGSSSTPHGSYDPSRSKRWNKLGRFQG